MIFVTVGTQLPFDRLVRTIDEWAGKTGRNDVFAQTGPSQYQPRSIRSSEFVTAPEFQRFVEQADIVIAHAGMGSILTSLELGKPIIVMPRRASLREHRNDHQFATAKHLLTRGRVTVVTEEEDLRAKLADIDRLIGVGGPRISKYASLSLLSTLRTFVDGGPVDIEIPAFVSQPAAFSEDVYDVESSMQHHPAMVS